MEELKDLDSLAIREKKQYSGIPAAWKLRPEFCLAGSADEELFYVVSEKGSLLGFDLLKGAKSFTLYLVDRQGEEVLYFEKRSGFFSNRLNVFNSDEELLGSVLSKKTSVKIIYHVLNQADQLLYRIEGSALAPDTFQVRQNDATVGKISKRWGKSVEEGVSKQAHFGIIFPLACGPKEKSLLLGALFLLDVFY